MPYADAYGTGWTAYPDVRPALDALEGRVRLAVLTNGDPTQQRAKLERLGLTGCFERLLTPTEVGAAKPAPAAFRAACAALGVAAGRAWYVGDDLAVDAVGATEAGLRGLWLDRHGEGDAAVSVPPAVPRIVSLGELPGIVARASRGSSAGRG